MTQGEMIIYTTDDGKAKITLRGMDGTVWLTQAQMAELFDTSTQNITQHIKNILDDDETDLSATCKDYLQVQNEGTRQVQRTLKLYSLEMILAVGMRVRSARGTQFRKWANGVLREYLVKGFALDDDRLKGAEKADYFDELLERIRDIRASEKRFYQKVRDLFALSYDYRGKEEETATFFATVQNKLLYAVTNHTAAELVIARADADQPNMNLQSFSGSVVRKTDIYVAKNYLNKDEIDSLNRLTVMFLDYAENRAKQRKTVTLNDWKENVDKFITFNEYPVLTGAGHIGADEMKRLVANEYAKFDARRKEIARREADEQDERELQAVENLERALAQKP